MGWVPRAPIRQLFQLGKKFLKREIKSFHWGRALLFCCWREGGGGWEGSYPISSVFSPKSNCFRQNFWTSGPGVITSKEEEKWERGARSNKTAKTTRLLFFPRFNSRGESSGGVEGQNELPFRFRLLVLIHQILALFTAACLKGRQARKARKRSFLLFWKFSFPTQQCHVEE